MRATLTISDIQSNKIWSIKWYRALTNKGLKESKDAIEAEMLKAFGQAHVQGLSNRILVIPDIEIRKDITPEDLKKHKNEIEQGMGCKLETEDTEIAKVALDFSVSMVDGVSQLNFKGNKIEAKMTVDSQKMLETVKWVIDNF